MNDSRPKSAETEHGARLYEMARQQGWRLWKTRKGVLPKRYTLSQLGSNLNFSDLDAVELFLAKRAARKGTA
jgi:hypothetical protein